MSTDLILVDDINIEDMIYEIRGKQVILDFTLAKLYEVETRVLNQSIKRNIEKFPKEFMFQLSENEWKFISSQFVMTSRNKRPNKSLPYAFTEQGVAMTSSILHSKKAIKMSVKIVDAFVKMRKFIKNNLLEQQFINNLVLEHDNEIKQLQELFDKLEEKEKTYKIFFDGQIYDAHSFFLKILSKSKEEIIIIDNYAGKELLDILKEIDKKIIIVSSNIDEILKKKYESQYHNVEFIHNNKFHDRFILIDKKELYSCGASFKDLGRKCFSINKIEDSEYINILLNKCK